jgi:hypothetical protein
MNECKRNNASPWQTHPKRMLRHKALIQCARLAFGFVGIYDQDEAERIVEKDVTPIVAAEDVSDELEAINNSQTIGELKNAFGVAYTKFKDKQKERDIITKAYNERKDYLLNAPVDADFEEVA